MLILTAFVFGAIIGSFLNVCVLRLPRNESIVFPPSHCMACNTGIRWYDNIPVVSYFILGGKCRNCGARFSVRYALVEALTGALFALIAAKYGNAPLTYIYAVFTAALIVETFIDFDHQIIPDEITLPGIGIGFFLSIPFPQMHGHFLWPEAAFQSLIGILLGGGILYAMAVIAEWVLKKEAMGGGDIKLLAMIGAVLGWKGVVWTLFVSSLLGSAVGIYQRVRNGQQLIPYGPYLAAAAVAYLFFGAQAFAWYATRLGF